MTTRDVDRPQEPVVSAADTERVERMHEGARMDGVRLVHYRKRFVVPGSKAEKRAERRVATFLMLAGVGGVAYLVITIAWPWRYHKDRGAWMFFTPLLGIAMALALFGLAAAIITFARRIMPEEEAVEERHDGFSDESERQATAATMLEAADAAGFGRRKLLKRSLGAAGVGLGALAIAPIGGLIKKPGKQQFQTLWKAGVRLVRDDGSPIRPADLNAGGIMSVFPDVPGSRDPAAADSPAMLFHLRPADNPKIVKGRESYHYQDFFCYSKLCTHAGCPVGLYERHTQRLLCPCHQSQFDVVDGCRPVFGPAARPLPQLPIELDSEGYFVAKGDFSDPIGPSFWERH